MIWKKEHVKPFISPTLKDEGAGQSTDVDFAIIGGGPKGFYALVHLVDTWQSYTDGVIRIDWFDQRGQFAHGPNFDPQLPEYLLVNNAIGNVEAVLSGFPSLTDWIQAYTHADFDARPTDFCSRALVGWYMQAQLTELLRRMPDHIMVRFIAGEIDSLKFDGTKLTTRFHRYDSVLCATGHSYTPKTFSDTKAPSTRSETTLVPTPYPLPDIKGLSGEKHNFVLRGMGLTFVDLALHIAESYGKFIEGPAELTYQPSKDFTIYPYSRTGTPMIPRKGVYGENRYRLKYMDEEWVQTLLREDKKVSFVDDVLPMLQREVQFAYYSTLLRTRDDQQVVRFVEQQSKPYTLNELLFPLAMRDGDMHQNTCEYLRHTITEAEKGELSSPLMAASAVWREASKFVSKLYNFGKMDGESQAIFNQQYYGNLSRVSYGPPIANMKKILFLADRGWLRFDFAKSPWIGFEDNIVTLKTNDRSVHADVWMNASVCTADLTHQNHSLLSSCIDNGLVDLQRNDDYHCGSVAIQPDGRAVSRKYPSIPLYFYGTPTEGNTLDNDSISPTLYAFGANWAKNTLTLIDSNAQQFTEQQKIS